MTYAAGTSVPIERSRMAIEALVAERAGNDTVVAEAPVVGDVTQVVDAGAGNDTVVAEALDQRPGGMTTGFGERLPMDAVDEPVGAGDDGDLLAGEADQGAGVAQGVVQADIAARLDDALNYLPARLTAGSYTVKVTPVRGKSKGKTRGRAARAPLASPNRMSKSSSGVSPRRRSAMPWAGSVDT